MNLPSRIISAWCCLFIACTCNQPSGTKTPTDVVTVPTPEKKPTLAPLPAAPTLDIQQEPSLGEKLTVVVARPQGPIRGEVRPTITFSRPVKSLEMVEAQRAADAQSPIATITPPLPGTWRWLGSASVELVPNDVVPMSTEYKVTVLKGLKALDGTQLEEDVSFTFSTPTLEFQESKPRNGDFWLNPAEPIVLLTNQPVANAELERALSLNVEGQPTPIRVKVTKRVSIEEERRANKPSEHAVRITNAQRGFANRQVRYTITAATPLPLHSRINLVVDPTIKAEEGPLPWQPNAAYSWFSYGPFSFSNAVFHYPRAPLQLTATNAPDFESLKTHLTVTPPVEIQWERAWSSPFHNTQLVTLAGNFKPGVTYTVQIKAGALDIFKQPTATDVSFTARSPDLNPYFYAGQGNALVEASTEKAPAPPRIPVEVVNINTLSVQMWKPSVTELITAIVRPYERSNTLVRPSDLSEDLKLKYEKNASRVHPVDLTRLFNGARTGAALVTISSPDTDSRYKSFQLVQVTDLAAHLKLGATASLAWVTSLSTGAAVSGATVTLYGVDGTSVWTGTTNAEGFAEIPGATSLKFPARQSEYGDSRSAPFAALLAEKNGDSAITASTWNEGVEPYSFDLQSGWEDETPWEAGMVFTDRGIYRPGDPVFVKAVIRYRQLGELRAPAPGSKFAVVVNDSRGNAIAKKELQTTAFGTLSFETVIPKEAPLGWASVSVSGAINGHTITFSNGFSVEEYRAPQFRVMVSSATKSVIAGSPLEATVSARYLFGGAMSEAALKWSAHRMPSVFSSRSLPDFTFAEQTWWWDDSHADSENLSFGSGEGLTDTSGGFTVKAGTAEAPAGKPYQYTIEGEVTDVNRQSVANRTDIMVHPAATYVGLRSKSYFMSAGKPHAIDTVVVDPDDKRVAGRPVVVTVSSRTWKSIKKKEAGGGFSTISEPVEEEAAKCTLTSGADFVPCSFTPPSSGFYIVRGQVTDEAGRKHQSSMGLYAIGSGFVAWQRNDTDHVELVTDKTEYKVGDVARVLIKSPYPTANAMITLEREGVLEHRAVVLKGSVETVEFPITEKMVPNIFVGVLMTRARVAEGGIETGDDPGRPAARVGYVKLAVENATKRVTLAVNTDRVEYQPRQTVTVSLDAKDSSGAPIDGEATVYAVDEAVLQLTGYTTPDPVTAIIREQPLSVLLGEPLIHLVRRRAYGEKGEDRGGGGGSGENNGIRNQFKTTPLFNPTVAVKNGKGTVTFTLPDNLTTFRVMAVLVTQRDRFGSGMTEIQINKPIMALPALPRFARVGDVFEAGVVVHATAQGTGDVIVKAKVEGGATLEGPAERTVAVTPQSPKEVRFAFKASSPGTAKFVFTATVGANNDGVQEAIPIELPRALDTVATYGDTTDTRVEGIVPPKDVDPAYGGLTVSMTSTSLGQFDQGFQQLVDYPYGCLEQQSSRLIPFIALREISGQFGVPWPGRNQKKAAAEDQLNSWLNRFLFSTLDVSHLKDPDEVVKTTVKSIVALQGHDGMFPLLV